MVETVFSLLSDFANLADYRELKFLVAGPEVRTRRRKAIRPPSPSKFSLPAALEASQVLSLAEIEEVQVALEAELIE